MATIRIGEILKTRGLLNEAQVQQILARQKLTGESFGHVASNEFGIEEAELWRAWAQQMIEYCPRMEPTDLTIEPRALSFLTAREAWAYRLLPVEVTDQEITLITTVERLPNAMAFAQIRSTVPAVIAVADKADLEAKIRAVYNISDKTSILPEAA